MRILVTGGCGFIGSNFIRHIMAEHDDVHIINVDKLTYCGNPDNLEDISGDKRYSFIKGDICDGGSMLDMVKDADIVVNFAAESHVDRSIKYPDDFFMTNIYGVKILLEAARKAGISRFIQVGTDEVYGSVDTGFSSEKDPLRPRSPYSASKASGDLLALSYYTTYGLPVIVTRSSNNYGPYQYPEKIIPLFITNLMDGKKVPLYGDGKNVRDWLFVEDNCEAIDLIMRKGMPGEVYNIGGGYQVSNIELTFKILRLMGLGEDRIQYVNDRPGHDRRYALDSSKVSGLGWSPSGDLDRKLSDTIDWYRDNTEWWRSVKEKAEIIEW